NDPRLTVLRYVERNPLRANLVTRAQDGPRSRLVPWLQPSLQPWLDPGPVSRPPDWLDRVPIPPTEAEIAALRRSVQRNRPYGSPAGVERTATDLGLESSLRAPGRPRGRGSKDTRQATLFVPVKR